MKRMRIASAVVAATLALGACGHSAVTEANAKAPAAPATHPVSGLPVVPLTITHAGKAHRFRVELARTGPEQEKGLMFRTTMGPDEGMIFPMHPPRAASFWMRNTVIGLDLIFIGPDGRILNIAAKAIPYDETPLNSAGPVKGVLELNAGRVAELGIVPGDVVKW
jgi:uncharacterized membrane protein (UPF0127 family)